MPLKELVLGSCCRAVVVGLSLLYLAGTGFARPPVVTRWKDPQGRMRPRHAVVGDRSPLALSRNLAASRGPAPAGDESGARICLVVHADVLAGIEAALNLFIADLEAEGWVPLLHEYSGGSAEALRGQLVTLHGESGSLAGAILIGNIPHVVYEMNQDWGWGEEYEDFPCDLFYMDLDGTWSDTNQLPPFAAGKYDTRGGNQDLEIWVSRLKADNLPALGGEIDLLNAYFRKAHRYRTGQMRPARRALMFNDDDWATMMADDAEATGGNYGDDHLRVVRDDENTTADHYLAQMTNSYELMFVRSHGYPGGHGFYENGRSNFNWISTGEYQAKTPPALFYSFYVCSGCDYTTSNHLGGIAVLNTNDSGLAAWGSTKTGGIWNDGCFYEPLAGGESFGAAFVNWFNISQTNYPMDAPPWWYRMVLLGDGSLRLSEESPVLQHAGPALAFTAQQGARYAIRRAETLTNPVWTNLNGDWVATNYQGSFVDLAPEAARAFYCVAKMEEHPANLLRNGSFEVSGSSDSRARYWEATGGGGHGDFWGSAARVDWRCQQGSMAAAVRGSWSGQDFGGWWQETAAQPGQLVRASAWFWADHVENTWTAAVQELKIEFLSGAFAVLETHRVELGDVGETWTQKIVSATAPAGTAWARFVINVSGSSATGALQFDRAALTREPE